jgi:tRNA dimethylallyltransferase
MKPRLAIILGPTGAGKSDLAVDVAVACGAEIVNADSQQVYRGMNIGTWKPSEQARRRVPHHLIDVVEPDQEFNAALFREKALAAVGDIQARGKNALVCGGTGLYIKALLYGLFVGPGRDAEVRQRLEREAREQGLGPLYRRLKEVDPRSAASIHPNDPHRIIRALEVLELTGKELSLWQSEHGFRESGYETLKIGVDRKREELYALINRRCEEMFELGLIEEARKLADQGYGLDLKPLQSIGYRHAGLFLRGEKSREEALDLMKRDTRKLAKRQLTWFRADKEIRWFHPEKDRRQILEALVSFFAAKDESRV